MHLSVSVYFLSFLLFNLYYISNLTYNISLSSIYVRTSGYRLGYMLPMGIPVIPVLLFGFRLISYFTDTIANVYATDWVE